MSRRSMCATLAGRAVEAITLSNGKGVKAALNYGAALQSLVMPDRDGKPADVTWLFTLEGVPNQPKLGSARLDPGATYRNVLVYRLFVNGARAH